MTTELSRFEPLIDDLIRAHKHLLSALLDHRAAIAKADAEAMDDAVGRQADALSRIASLDQERREIAAPFATKASGPNGPTLTQLSQELPEADRARVAAKAESLRTLIESARREQGTVRAAAESLVAHMEGLMRQVARRLSHAGTYGPRGAVAPDQVVTGIDLTH